MPAAPRQLRLTVFAARLTAKILVRLRAAHLCAVQAAPVPSAAPVPGIGLAAAKTAAATLPAARLYLFLL